MWIYFCPEEVDTSKAELLQTVGGNSALTVWQLAMCPASAH
jgi:hypothetical protein